MTSLKYQLPAVSKHSLSRFFSRVHIHFESSTAEYLQHRVCVHLACYLIQVLHEAGGSFGTETWDNVTVRPPNFCGKQLQLIDLKFNFVHSQQHFKYKWIRACGFVAYLWFMNQERTNITFIKLYYNSHTIVNFCSLTIFPIYSPLCSFF